MANKDIKILGRALKDFSDAQVKEVKEIVADHGSILLDKATRTLNNYTAPSFIESFNFINLDLKSSDNGLTFTVGVPSADSGDKRGHIAAYIEFGTGLYAEALLQHYPSEIRALAMRYFVNGKGTIKAYPYLFNNYFIVRDNFIKELSETINKKWQL